MSQAAGAAERGVCEQLSQVLRLLRRRRMLLLTPLVVATGLACKHARLLSSGFLSSTALNKLVLSTPPSQILSSLLILRKRWWLNLSARRTSALPLRLTA